MLQTSENSSGGQTGYDAIISDVNNRMSEMGYRPVRASDIKYGVVLARVEVQRFFMAEERLPPLGSYGVKLMSITDLSPKMMRHYCQDVVTSNPGDDDFRYYVRKEARSN